MALHCLYRTDSFAECILKVINLGGDADSVGAVAGQLAGAVYGVNAIPREAKEALLRWDNNGEIALRGIYLFNEGIQ